jgi:hypothetical protein
MLDPEDEGITMVRNAVTLVRFTRCKIPEYRCKNLSFRIEYVISVTFRLATLSVDAEHRLTDSMEQSR